MAVPPVVSTVFLIRARTPPIADCDNLKPSWTQKLLSLDYLGIALLLPSVTCLILALEFGGSLYGWGDGRTIGAFVASGVLTSMYVAEQWWMGEKALVPPRIIRKRVVIFSSLFSFCLESAFLTLVYYVSLVSRPLWHQMHMYFNVYANTRCFKIPLWFQAIQGATPEQSGVCYLSLCGAFILAIFGSGWAVSNFGYFQPFMLVGTILVSIGAGLLSTLDPLSGPSKWVPYQIIAGLGIGASTEQPSVAAQSLLSETDAPIGVAVVLFCRNLGPAAIISVANTIFARTLSNEIERKLPGQTLLKSIAESGATKLREKVAAHDSDVLLEIYNKALTRTFLVAAVLSAASVVGLAGIGTQRIKTESGDKESTSTDDNNANVENPAAS